MRQVTHVTLDVHGNARHTSVPRCDEGRKERRSGSVWIQSDETRNAARALAADLDGCGETGKGMWGALDFFFQAEDGMRAYDVTGVQTCALPI